MDIFHTIQKPNYLISLIRASENQREYLEKPLYPYQSIIVTLKLLIHPIIAPLYAKLKFSKKSITLKKIIETDNIFRFLSHEIKYKDKSYIQAFYNQKIAHLIP